MNSYVIVKLATTGLDAVCDDITQIVMFKVENNEITKRVKAYVKPSCSISEEAMMASGVTNKAVEHAHPFSEIKESVKEFIGSCPVVGFYNDFERGFLKKYGIEYTSLDLRAITRNYAGCGTLKSALRHYLGQDYILQDAESKAYAIKELYDKLAETYIKKSKDN